MCGNFQYYNPPGKHGEKHPLKAGLGPKSNPAAQTAHKQGAMLTCPPYTVAPPQPLKNVAFGAFYFGWL
jgi:hypothetical protein